MILNKEKKTNDNTSNNNDNKQTNKNGKSWINIVADTYTSRISLKK